MTDVLTVAPTLVAPTFALAGATRQGRLITARPVPALIWLTLSLLLDAVAIQTSDGSLALFLIADALALRYALTGPGDSSSPRAWRNWTDNGPYTPGDLAVAAKNISRKS